MPKVLSLKEKLENKENANLKFSISLPPKTKSKLADICKRNKTNQSQVIEELINDFELIENSKREIAELTKSSNSLMNILDYIKKDKNEKSVLIDSIKTLLEINQKNTSEIEELKTELKKYREKTTDTIAKINTTNENIANEIKAIKQNIQNISITMKEESNKSILGKVWGK